MSPKIPPKAPQEGHAVEKNSAVSLRRNTIEPSQKISQNILNSSQKVDVICQNRPQILLNDPLKMGAWCQKKSTSDNQSYAKNTSMNFMTKYWTDIKKNKYICKNRSQKFSKMVPTRQGALFVCIDQQHYTKNSCTKFHEKILNDSQEIK